MALGRRILDLDDCTESCSTPPPPPSSPSPLSSAIHSKPTASSPPSPPTPGTPIQISNANHLLKPIVVLIISLLSVCLLLLALYVLYHYWSFRHRRRRALAFAAAWGPPQPPADASESLLMTGEEPYHVWCIRTVGLDQAVIGSISVCEYRKGEGLVDDADCAVCLGAFGEGELLRLLPKCGHAFHVPCIDTWLRSHVNCPLCRAPVLCPRPASELPSPTIESGNLSSELTATHPSSRQDIAREDSAEEEGCFRHITTPDECESSAQVGIMFQRPTSGASFSSEESGTWMSIDLGDDGSGVEAAPVAAVHAGSDGNREPQPVRRSLTMDSSAMTGLLLRIGLGGSTRDGRRKPRVGEVGTSPHWKLGNEANKHKRTPSLDARPAELERCMSSGTFASSRLSGRAHGTVLPQ